MSEYSYESYTFAPLAAHMTNISTDLGRILCKRKTGTLPDFSRYDIPYLEGVRDGMRIETEINALIHVIKEHGPVRITMWGGDHAR